MSPSIFFDRLAYLLSAPKCVACGERLEYGENALCPECSATFEEIKNRNCSRCAKILSRCTCSNDYLSRHYIRTQIKVFRYKNREENICANSLIFSLKKDNRRDVLAFCASELADAISASVENPGDVIFTNVPRRRSQIVKYGIDHAELLAKEVARVFGATYKRLLKSNVKSAQKEQYGEQRKSNIDFDLVSDENLVGKRVIIVDDIVTTGASMSASAMLIRGLGAKCIIGAALAIAYKEDHSYI